MTCREAAFKKLFNIDLAAGCCKCEEVHIVDMDIAAGMSFRMLRIEDKHGIELLCALRAILEHCTHCRVAVDVCVFTLDVAVDGIGECEVLVHLHKTSVHLSALCAFCAVKDIFLGRSCVAVFDECMLNSVLHLLNSRNCIAESLCKVFLNLECKLKGCIKIVTAESLCSGKDGVCYFFAVIRDFASVSFDYLCYHGSPVFYTLSIQYLYNKLFY